MIHLKGPKQNRFVALSLFLSIQSFGQDGGGEPKEKKHLWEILGDAVSDILPHGTGSIRFDNSGVDSEGNRRFGDPTEPGSAASTHITTFGTLYLAAMLVETAASPVVLTVRNSAESSEDSTRNSQAKNQQEEIEKLKRKNESLERENKELIEKLKSQAEQMIDSYEKPGKVGIEVGPELKRYFNGVRSKLSSGIAHMALVSGMNADEANSLAKRTLKKISDLDIAKEFLFISAVNETGE